jgi:acetyl-CoA acetyltransferase
MREVVIVSAARTPVGDFGGAFRDMLSHQLAVIAVQEAVKTTPKWGGLNKPYKGLLLASA